MRPAPIVRRRRGRPAVAASLLAGVLLLPGCAAWWGPVTGQTPRPYTLPLLEISLDLPLGFMSPTGPAVWGHHILTRHGVELEEIQLRRWPRTATVKGTNRSITDGMLIQDIAALSLDSRRLDDGVGGLEVVSNRLAEVGGQECYRIDYRFRNANGLSKRTIEYGCPVGTWLYRFEYSAPSQYYFGLYEAEFEAMVRSIRFSVAGA